MRNKRRILLTPLLMTARNTIREISRETCACMPRIISEIKENNMVTSYILTVGPVRFYTHHYPRPWPKVMSGREKIFGGFEKEICSARILPAIYR